MFQALTCTIVLAGDQRQKHVRGPFRYVTYPELLILQHLHGEAHVIDVQEIGAVDTPLAEERERLNVTYGRGIVDRLYPGAMARLPERGHGYPRYEGEVPGHVRPLPPKEEEPKAAKGKTRGAPAKEPETASEPDALGPVDLSDFDAGA